MRHDIKVYSAHYSMMVGGLKRTEEWPGVDAAHPGDYITYRETVRAGTHLRPSGRTFTVQVMTKEFRDDKLHVALFTIKRNDVPHTLWAKAETQQEVTQ
jgi:hypothetical protein